MNLSLQPMPPGISRPAPDNDWREILEEWCVMNTPYGPVFLWALLDRRGREVDCFEKAVSFCGAVVAGVHDGAWAAGPVEALTPILLQ